LLPLYLSIPVGGCFKTFCCQHLARHHPNWRWQGRLDDHDTGNYPLSLGLRR
jgi:hypothetical protein